MAAAPEYIEYRLSGRYRYRSTIFKKVILQVEVEKNSLILENPSSLTSKGKKIRTNIKKYWRDANWKDFKVLRNVDLYGN